MLRLRSALRPANSRAEIRLPVRLGRDGHTPARVLVQSLALERLVETAPFQGTSRASARARSVNTLFCGIVQPSFSCRFGRMETLPVQLLWDLRA